MAGGPIIILGMHRSGTSMLTSILMQHGFYAGSRLDTHYEDLFFVKRNEWLLRRCGGAWDYPLVIRPLFEKATYGDFVVNAFIRDMNNNGFSRYRKIIASNAAAWGWKDPRTIFTLPIWLKIFPDAKILYIKRNGIDVAASLYKRALQVDTRLFSSHSLRRKIANLVHSREEYACGSLRCCSLEACYRLWEEYTLEAEKQYKLFNGLKQAIRYEDILAEPQEVIRQLVDFFKLDDMDPEKKIAEQVNEKRKYSFVTNSELIKFYQLHRDDALMVSLGYNKIATDVDSENRTVV